MRDLFRAIVLVDKQVYDCGLFRDNWVQARSDATQLENAYANRPEAEIVIRMSEGHGSSLRLVKDIPVSPSCL